MPAWQPGACEFMHSICIGCLVVTTSCSTATSKTILTVTQGGVCNSNPFQRRVTLMISDVCEPCHPGGPDHIDMQALEFQKVTGTGHLLFLLSNGSCQCCLKACEMIAWLPHTDSTLERRGKFTSSTGGWTVHRLQALSCS